VLVVAGLSVIEGVLRSHGHKPTVIDTRDLWAYHRHRVYDSQGKKTVVLIGGSRIQLDFVPPVFEKEFPQYRVVQLAVDGAQEASGVVLADLANDPRFDGIVLWSTTMFPPAADSILKPYLNTYRDNYRSYWPAVEEVTLPISLAFQEHLALLYPTVRLDAIFKSIVRYRTLPDSPYVATFRDRSRLADYSQVDVQEHCRIRIQQAQEIAPRLRGISPDMWLQQAMDYEPFVRKIQSRGGRVVYVRDITTGQGWDLDEQLFPKQQCWDRLARQTSAATIHFADVPGMRDFVCPDTSHLDCRDAPRYTLALARELERLGVLCQGPAPQP
jgi:hypothetical protein